MAYNLPEIGLDLSSSRRPLAVRDRTNGVMVPLAILNTLLHKWELDKDVLVPPSALPLEVSRSLNPLTLYGFIGDGASHPISGVTYFKGTDTTGFTLAQWQSLVPQVTALTNEIDGVAIQAALNATGMVAVPDGAVALASFGLVTSGGETVIRGDKIQIRWKTDVATGITHGTASAPATGRFYFTGRCGLWKDVGAGSGSALSLRFAETGAATDYSGSLGKILVRNWGAPGIQIIDFPRGMTLDEVIVWGADNTLVNGDAISISGNKTRGTFGFQVYNCMTVNYRWGFGIDINAKGGGEGYIIESCRSYAGGGFLRVNNTVYAPSANEYYQPPLWRILHCDWEGYGTAISLSGVSDCLFDGFLPILNPRGNNPDLDPGRIFDIKNSRNVKIRAGEILVLPGVNNSAADALTGSSFPIIFKINKQCKNITIERPSISCNSTAFYLACEANDFGAGQVKEFGATFDPAFSGTLRFDPGNNQVCEAAVRALGGTVNVDTGEVGFIGSLAGTTNASGILASSLPTGLFRTVNSTRSRVWNNDADAAPFAQATLKGSTLTTAGLQALWAQNGAALTNANVRQSYDIRGT